MTLHGYVIKVNRKYFTCMIEEVWFANIKIELVDDRSYLFVGAYFKITNSGKVIMNKKKWTKKDLEKANQKAKQLVKGLRFV